MKKVWLGLLLPFMVLSSCATEPGPPQSGRRDYTWTSMRVTNLPSDMFYSITGNSPTNIYVGGDQGLWRFDGTRWQQVSSTFLSSVCVTPSGKVWGVKGSMIYLHEPSQSGQPMREIRDFTNAYSDYPNVIFNNIWCDADNNVYALGWAYKTERDIRELVSFLARYDGRTWQTVPNSKIRYMTLLNIAREGNSTRYYLNATRTDSLSIFPRGYTNFELDTRANSFRQIYSGIILRGIFSIQKSVVFFDEFKAFKYQLNAFEVWKDFTGSEWTMGILYGRNDNDIFIYNYRKEGMDVLHYNGENISMVYPGNQVIGDQNRLFGAVLFEKDIFILSEDNPATSNRVIKIIHGKLP
jgi:hypothetical protein